MSELNSFLLLLFVIDILFCPYREIINTRVGEAAGALRREKINIWLIEKKLLCTPYSA